MNLGLKSIAQLQKQLIDKKSQIKRILTQLNISDIPQNIDYESQNLTFQKIFNMIPSQQRLKQILQQSTPDQRDIKLKIYKGKYQIVNQAAKRVDQLKSQSKNIYYLFSQLNLPKIKNQFKKNKQSGKIKLRSFDIVNVDTQIKQQKSKSKSKKKHNEKKQNTSSLINTKSTKFQRNTISQDYIYSIKENSKDQQLMLPNQYLKNDDILITVSIYDSLNRQKQNQFVFLGDMKLFQLKKQIYCQIQKLSKQQSEQIKNQQKIILMKKQSKNQSSFFLIEQNIYYSGTHNSQQQIDNLIKTIKISYQTDFHKFSMNNIQLKNLRVVFGRPYLYRHMGGCDHMIIFKDIKLFDKQNGIQPQSKKKYPFMIFQSKMKKRKCQGCEIKYAKLACKGDKLKNGQTSYLCQECHENIHNQMTNPKNKLMSKIPYLHQ